MVNSSIKLVFGGSQISPDYEHGTPELVEELLKVLQAEGVNAIDTSDSQKQAELLLGQTQSASRFDILAKHTAGIGPFISTKETVLKSAEGTLENLKRDSVDVYFLHAPDRKNPFEGPLAALDELYKAGKFKRWGLSNFRADEIEEVIRIAKENNYVLPSVYEGYYSAVGRRTETDIIPTLRKHNMAFYAYSPIACGFLTKSADQLPTAGRWDPSSLIGQMIHSFFDKPSFQDALRKWEDISKRAGIPKAELAYRWIAYNSKLQGELGDAIIIGPRTIEQLKQTTEGLRKGPLSPEIAKEIDEVWNIVEKDSILDFYNDFLCRF